MELATLPLIWVGHYHLSAHLPPQSSPEQSPQKHDLEAQAPGTKDAIPTPHLEEHKSRKISLASAKNCIGHKASSEIQMPLSCPSDSLLGHCKDCERYHLIYQGRGVGSESSFVKGSINTDPSPAESLPATRLS